MDRGLKLVVCILLKCSKWSTFSSVRQIFPWAISILQVELHHFAQASCTTLLKWLHYSSDSSVLQWPRSMASFTVVILWNLPWAAWSSIWFSGWQLCPWQGSWNEMILEVLSNPSHSPIHYRPDAQHTQLGSTTPFSLTWAYLGLFFLRVREQPPSSNNKVPFFSLQ